MERLSFRERSPRCIVLNEDLEDYESRKGCYMDGPRCFVTLLLFLILAASTGYAVFYFTGCKPIEHPVSSQKADANLSWNDLHLPSNIKPLLYRLRLKPILDHTNDSFSFTGTVWITFASSGYTSHIDLNAKGLTIVDKVILTTESMPKTSAFQSKVPIEIVPSKWSHLLDSDESESSDVDSNTLQDTIELENTTILTQSEVPSENYNSSENETITEVIARQTGTEYTPILTLSEPLTILKYIANDTVERLTFYVDKPIEPGKNYTIMISFNGVLNDGTSGFFWKHYTEFGETKYLAAIQLHPALAHTLFPCFDEPRFRAPFEISVSRLPSMQSVSNGEFRGFAVGEDDYILDNFSITPSLSPSSIFVMVSELHKQEIKISDNTILELWSRQELMAESMQASATARALLEAYQQFTDVDFIINKLHFIAIPDKFDDDTHSFGIIGLREYDLFLDARETSLRHRIHSIQAIANQIARALFNRVLTIDKWSDLWLSESIMRYLSLLVAHQIRVDEHDMAVFNDFFGETSNIMRLDSLTSIPALSGGRTDSYKTMGEVSDISAIKGADLLRMCNYIWENGSLYEELGLYLRQIGHADPSGPNIWNVFDKSTLNNAANISVGDFLKSWADQRGYPVVNISINYSEGTIKLTQEPFATKSDALWYIPISYTTSDTDEKWSSSIRAWMNKEKQIEIFVPSLKQNLAEWIIFNDLRTGYYRVNYDNATWSAILEVLNLHQDQLEVVTIAQLLDDALNLALAGYISFDVPLNMTRTLRSGTPALVWCTALSNLEAVENILANTPSYGLFKAYMLKLLEPIYYLLQTKQAMSADDYMLQSHIVKWACHLGQAHCLQWARNAVESWFQDRTRDNTIPVNLRQSMYCTTVAISDSTLWENIYDAAISEKVLSERRNLLKSLACTKESWLINRLFEKMINGSEVTKSDAVTILKSLRAMASGDTIMRTLKDHWVSIYKKFINTPTILSSFVNSLSKLAHEDDLQQFQNFMSTYERTFEAIPLTTAIIRETIMKNIQYKKNHVHEITSWLSENVREFGF